MPKPVRITIINQFYLPDLSPTAHLAASLANHRAGEGDEVTVVTSNAGYVESPRWNEVVGQSEDSSDLSGERSEAATSASSYRTRNSASSRGRLATKSQREVRVIRLAIPGGGKSSLRSRLGGYGGFTAGAWLRLALLPRQDVIVSMTTPPYIVLAAFLHRLLHRRTKIVLWSMDVYPDTAEAFDQLGRGSLVSKLLRRINTWIYPRLDHLVVLDSAMGEVLQRQYGSTDRPPTTIIPNWEPLASFPNPATHSEAPGTSTAFEIWAEYSTNPQLANRDVVAYLGNTGTGHSFDTVIQAAGRLAHQNAAFLFVGGGVRRPTLETAALALAEGRGAPIVLYDYVSREQVPSVFAGAMASLITLDDRAWGLMSPSKLHSALAAGLPIIYVGPTGTNVDEAIQRHGCGVSLRNGDVEGLVAAVKQLSTDVAYREHLAQAARHAFETSYCDAATLPEFDTVINGLVHRNR
ncbi:MAG: glycosyltransferase family 4 protein [Acidimicrobiia bacterium]